MRNLLAFWLGGMAAGVTTALVVVLFLRNFAVSIMREVVSAVSSPIVADIQVAIGVLAVVIGARFWARQHARVPVSGGDHSVLVLEPNTPTGASRLSIRGHLEGGSLVVAFGAGLALATPPVEYLAAIIVILASRATAADQVATALMFTLVAFTVVEIPLVTYLATPAKTLAVMQRVNAWISERRQPIIAAVVSAFGVLLVVTGMRHI
jgi:hypothetical protein